MSQIYTQTDTSQTFDVGCSGRAAATTTQAREMAAGATAGSTSAQVSLAGSTPNVAAINFRTTGGVGAGVWAAGDYVVRLNITAASNQITWTETYICERTSGGAFNSVASLTGQTTAVNAGVKTHTVNRATNFNPAGTDSDLFIVLVFSNNRANPGTIDITPNQNVDTPIVVSASGDITYWNVVALADISSLNAVTAANISAINEITF